MEHAITTYEKHIYPQHGKFHLLPDFLRGEAVEVKLIDESSLHFKGNLKNTSRIDFTMLPGL